jgi:hypothetical protein
MFNNYLTNETDMLKISSNIQRDAYFLTSKVTCEHRKTTIINT